MYAAAVEGRLGLGRPDREPKASETILRVTLSVDEVLREARALAQRLRIEHFEELEYEVATADDSGTHAASIATSPLLPQ